MVLRRIPNLPHPSPKAFGRSQLSGYLAPVGIALEYSEALRRKVYRRDGGVCVMCGLDCIDLRRAINYVLRKIRNNHLGFDVGEREFLMAARIPRHIAARHAFWDVDHIEPWAKTQNDEITNLRTLC